MLNQSIARYHRGKSRHPRNTSSCLHTVFTHPATCRTPEKVRPQSCSLRHLPPRKRSPDHAASPGRLAWGRLAWGKVRPQLRLGGRDRGAQGQPSGACPLTGAGYWLTGPLARGQPLPPAWVTYPFAGGPDRAPCRQHRCMCLARRRQISGPPCGRVPKCGRVQKTEAPLKIPVAEPPSAPYSCVQPVPARHRDRRGWGRKLLSRTPVCCKGTCE
jgi:hypothetical protein